MVLNKRTNIVALLILTFCIFSICTKTFAKEYDSPQQKQKLMKITNDFVLEGKNNGLIKKVDKVCDSGGCIFTFWINENFYNQYGYEDKQGIRRLIMEYGQLRGVGGVMRGYYSGKFL